MTLLISNSSTVFYLDFPSGSESHQVTQACLPYLFDHFNSGGVFTSPNDPYHREAHLGHSRFHLSFSQILLVESSLLSAHVLALLSSAETF